MKGKNLENADLIDDFLDDVGITDEKDRNFVVERLQKMVNGEHTEQNSKSCEDDDSSNLNPEDDVGVYPE